MINLCIASLFSFFLPTLDIYRLQGTGYEGSTCSVSLLFLFFLLVQAAHPSMKEFPFIL